MRRALGLALLLVAGHLSALRLIEVRPYAVFQHYMHWTDIGSGESWSVTLALAVLALQWLVCLALGWRRLLAMASTLARWLGGWRLVLGLGVLAFALAVPSESVRRFGAETVLAGWIAAGALLNLVLLGAELPAGLLRRAGAWITTRVTLTTGASEPRAWDRALPWVGAAWVTALSAAIAWFVFEGVPHIDDSIVYLFQAKYYAQGLLTVPAPVDYPSFAVTHLINDGERMYGKFFPGWPALLALGVIAGVPWLVNPLLGGAALVLAHHLVRRVYDRGTANATTLLLAVSPWLLFNSSEMMSHAASLAWMLLAFLAIDLQRGRRVGIWSLVAGVSLGAIFLTRPFDAVLIGPVAALWAWGVAGRRLSYGSLAAIALVAAGAAAVMLPYNAALTGSMTSAPHRLWAESFWGPGVDVMGFGANVGIPLWRNVDPLPGHGLADVVLNANKNFFLVNFELFGWACGSLVLATFACLAATRSGRWAQGDTLMCGILLAVIGGHSIYWTSGGPDFGARYWYLIILPLVVLTVRGAQLLAAGPGVGVRLPSDLGARVTAVIVVASVTAFLCVTPWRCVTKYYRYRDVAADPRSLAAERQMGRALVFVRSPSRADYQSAFNFNSPGFSGPGPVYVLDAGPQNRARIAQQYADRPVWILGPGSKPGSGLVVLAGPLPPGSTPAGGAYEYERSFAASIPAPRR